MKNKQIKGQAAIILLIVLLNLFNKTWRDFPKYYKNIGYVGLVNIFYYYLCSRHLVWEFPPVGANWKLLRIMHIFFITPLLVLSFLSRYPSTLSKQFLHVIKWVTASSITEYIAHKQKLLQYKHGWTIFWSALLYLKMFMYSKLIVKRPLTTLFLSVCSVAFLIKKFKVPINKKHRLSKNCEWLTDCFYHSSLEDIF
ncbi:CBO0543 family protein [Evansella clarkii]|uniref:CBO0543 family protein n=1 Tax=Evansella clarkii TaxID=79879 RepID=UPI000997C256|nr:CBO0543 family protein [Evansella clarkii]